MANTHSVHNQNLQSILPSSSHQLQDQLKPSHQHQQHNLHNHHNHNHHNHNHNHHNHHHHQPQHQHQHQQDLSPTRSYSSDSEDIDDDDDDDDPLSAPDQLSSLLPNNRKHLNIYDTDPDLANQPLHPLLPNPIQSQLLPVIDNNNFQNQIIHSHLTEHHSLIKSAQPLAQQQAHQQQVHHRVPVPNDPPINPIPIIQPLTHSSSGPSPSRPNSSIDHQPPLYNNSPSNYHPHPISKPRPSADLNKSLPSHSDDRTGSHQRSKSDHQPTSTLSASAEATCGTHRPTSRLSMHTSQPRSTVPPTNRSRLGSADTDRPPPRPRRVSDGSIGGGVRKDLLLQRMAEALQSERAKAVVFQRELQNAEHEIDELANTLDEQRRAHHKTVVALRKDISRLKHERESLVQALEAAEGVEQDEAERYLALLDPAAQAVMAEEDDAPEEQVAQKKPAPAAQPLVDDYKSTVRAQMQERSAQRAQRINLELLKLNPAPPSAGGTGDEDPSSEPARQGRPAEPNHTRMRRKLSKSRPGSRDGLGGLFWRRSGSRNREMSDEKASSAQTTVLRSTTEHRSKRVGGTSSSTQHLSGSGAVDDEGYYDSGPLQRSCESVSGRSGTANGKIGKLFRKVFPVHREEEDGDREHQDGGMTGAGEMGGRHGTTRSGSRRARNYERAGGIGARRYRSVVVD